MQGEHLCEKVEIKDTDEYLEYLDDIRPATAFIAIVQPDGFDEDDPVIVEADACMELVGAYKTNNWPGTRTREPRAQLHMYKASREFFDYLYDIPAFFFNEIGLDGSVGGVELTEFGIDDIVFMDRKKNILLYTTTHEGGIYMNEDYI